MSGKTVFILTHCFTYGEDDWYDEEKILGVYETMEQVTEAIDRYSQLNGFIGCEKESFFVGRYVVDRDENWKDGFIKAEEA